MSVLELEQAMRDDPALAGEYRRLAALREAVRRHAPRERAPQGLTDRIGALTAPVEAEVSTASAAILPFRRATPGPMRMLALRRRSRPAVSPSAPDSWRSDSGRLGRRRHRPRRRLRARRDRRPTVRRRLIRPAYGEALARRPHNRQREHRRSRQAGLPACGRPCRSRRPDPGADARLPSQRAPCRRDRAALAPGKRAQEAQSRQSMAITSCAGLMRTSLISPCPIWTKRRSLISSRRSAKRKSLHRRGQRHNAFGLRRNTRRR